VKNRFIPNHWSFGVNLSNINRMREEIIEPILNDMDRYIYRIPRGCDPIYEINIDVLISTLFQYERINDKYIAFITKEAFYHKGFPDKQVFEAKLHEGQYSWKFAGGEGKAPLHPKTIILE
jgi:hypothetical protein